MKERPILFSGEMVRAILDGRKTQTRRVIKPQPPQWNWNTRRNSTFNVQVSLNDNREYWVKCPYGAHGGYLWVRETWNSDQQYADYKPSEIPKGAPIYYKADVGEPDPDGVRFIWRPSIFMPRMFSRITLEITGVRVKQVQDINADDCLAEGCPMDHLHDVIHPVFEDGTCVSVGAVGQLAWFRNLWDSINAKRGYGWKVNPWVWVIEFKKLETT